MFCMWLWLFQTRVDQVLSLSWGSRRRTVWLSSRCPGCPPPAQYTTLIWPPSCRTHCVLPAQPSSPRRLRASPGSGQPGGFGSLTDAYKTAGLIWRALPTVCLQTCAIQGAQMTWPAWPGPVWPRRLPSFEQDVFEDNISTRQAWLMITCRRRPASYHQSLSYLTTATTDNLSTVSESVTSVECRLYGGWDATSKDVSARWTVPVQWITRPIAKSTNLCFASISWLR